MTVADDMRPAEVSADAVTDHRVVSVEDHVVRELSASAREPLLDALYEVFCTRFVGPSRDIVGEHVILRHPDARLSVFRNARGQVLGFTSSEQTVHRDGRGRPCTVFDAGAYLRPGVKGIGGAVLSRIVLPLLWEKVRHPLRPIVYLGAATNPAVYALTGRQVWRLQPRPDREPPAQVTELVARVMASRGYRTVGGDPWRINLGVEFAFTDEERISRFVQRSDSPWVEAYVRRNPGFLAGDWLAMYTPLTVLDILAIVWRGLRGRSRMGRG